ncbi:hypothetical protein L596_021407 [Steinernema carpocapsae]|uniref:Uncharacterized protein n=1 Tax=Steinernema carpocapsae TaxID=34508 RepID=A0A4U5MJH2_STECR|nr:hypothetical protein L596_021407 [Steinernema carpocapsae]
MARNGFRTAQYGKDKTKRRILPVVERSRRDNPDRDAVAYGEIGFGFAFLSVGEIVVLRRKLNFTPKCAPISTNFWSFTFWSVDFIRTRCFVVNFLSFQGRRAGQARVKRAGTAV